MQLTRRDAVRALGTTAVAGGIGIAVAEREHRALETTDRSVTTKTMRRLVAIANTIYPSQVEVTEGYVKAYVSGLPDERREATVASIDAIARAADETDADPEDADPDDPLETAVERTDPISIDYAVLERTDEAYVVPVSFEWDDLGSWDAMERLVEADEDGNAILGDAFTVDAGDNVIATEEAHVSVVGAADLVVAAYDDRVLVVPKAAAQRVREVVDRLREDDRF